MPLKKKIFLPLKKIFFENIFFVLKDNRGIYKTFITLKLSLKNFFSIFNFENEIFSVLKIHRKMSIYKDIYKGLYKGLI